MDRPPVTHGRHGRSIRLENFVLTQAQYPPNLSVERHEHALPSWTYVASGSFCETFTRHDELCTAGKLLSKPATATHSNRYGPAGASCLLIELSGPELMQDRGMRRLFDTVARCTTGRCPGWARRIMHLLSKDASPPPLVLESLLLDIAAEMTNERTGPRSSIAGNRVWLAVARDRLTAEFRAPPSMKSLAASLGVHPVYLSQTFRRAFGCSPGEFVRRQRIEFARAQLMSTDAPISMIALSAGFSDQSHFTRHFHASVGLSPARFRASNSAPPRPYATPGLSFVQD